MSRIDLKGPKPKLKVDVWLNVYRTPRGITVTTVHDTLEKAKKANRSRYACLHVEAEVAEGFGITPQMAEEE